MIKVAQPVSTPSSFAYSFLQFAQDHGIDGSLCDLGCGNGRDTLLLATKFSVIGVDPNTNKQGDQFIAADAIEISTWHSSDVVYSRFFLHSISFDDVKQIIAHTKDIFAAEARAMGDCPILYPDHPRNFINPVQLISTLLENDFLILSAQIGYGMAILNKEDPLIIRVIAQRKKRQ